MNSEPTMRHVGGPTGTVDQLSALPDGLLHAIMSFLRAPQAVRTCVLSRRWRHLWRSTPCIKIDDKDFGVSRRISLSTFEERWARFENFATNLLMFHDNTSSLDEFRLCCCAYNWCHVERWIRRGFEYCPAMLQIHMLEHYDIGFKFPPVADSSFRRVKRLSLLKVHLGSHFMGSLCSACPVLEDLDLILCEFCDNYPQGITSSTLNKLELGSCFNNTSHPLVITAPSLTSLSLTYGCYQAGILLCKMDSLVEAKIYIKNYDETQTISQKIQLELLGSLFNVTRLELEGFEAEVMLIEKCDKFPIFRNMKTLGLDSCFLDDNELNDKLKALGSFLQNAPFLEKLTMECCMFTSSSDSEWEIKRKSITLQRQDRKTLQCHKLKLIEVIYDHDHDHRLIEFVWSLGRSLPDVNIELTKL